MTPDDLHDTAFLIYGRSWQTSMAEDFDINPRTVRRWAASGAPDWVRDRLRVSAKLLMARLGII